MDHSGHSGHSMHRQHHSGTHHTNNISEIGEAVLNIIQGISPEEETEVYEMLHIPVLHGGIKEALLFPGCFTTNEGNFVFACFVLILLTALLEFIRYGSSQLEKKVLGPNKNECGENICKCKHCNFPTSLLNPSETIKYDAIHDVTVKASKSDLLSPEPTPCYKKQFVILILSSLLTFFTYIMSTFLMLIAMTMNIYIIISLGCGAALGKGLLLHLRSRNVL